jgi:histidinol dehydrogenase
MRVLSTQTDIDSVKAALLPVSDEKTALVESSARTIVNDVRLRGDDAVAEYTRKFDWAGATTANLLVDTDTLHDARAGLDRELGKVFSKSEKNIRDYHNSERRHLQTWSQNGVDGTSLGQIIRPVSSAGIYTPGAKADYPSTVLMAVIPAIVAGVKNIVLCSPADQSGAIPTSVAAAAADLNINKVFRIGGAQAIAAMAYGTASVPKVDVIAGPGNSYVNAAKRIVSGDVGIDMLAGPSEIAIIADAGANPAFAAADLLAQTEHGPDNRGFVFSPSKTFIDDLQVEIIRQREKLKRQEILAQTDKNLTIVLTSSIEEAAALSNILAPEHLELQVREPHSLLPLIENAGAILLGDYSSAPIGDYFAGPSHTLPTAGASRFSSPLSVSTFLKRTSVIYFNEEAALSCADDVARFAMAEGFDGHANAATIRKKINI